MVNTENEIWKETHLSPYYLVSNLGRVKSIERDVPCRFGTRRKKEKILTPKDHHGYYHVGFKVNGKHVNPLVHQLVMFAFNEIRHYPEWEIDHIDGNSHNNRLENLEYVTSSENSIRAIKLGLQMPESMSKHNWLRKITPEQVIEMKNQFLKEGRVWGCKRGNWDFIERYAKMYNMKPGSIHHILIGRTNRFFGEDIVQTTKIKHPIVNYNDLDFSKCYSKRDKLREIAKAFNIGEDGPFTMSYTKKKTLEEIVDYYNKKFNCVETHSSKG